LAKGLKGSHNQEKGFSQVMITKFRDQPETGCLMLCQEKIMKRLLVDLKPVALSLVRSFMSQVQRWTTSISPATSHVSLLYTMSDGLTAEMGLVGNEGVVGICSLHGGDTTPIGP